MGASRGHREGVRVRLRSRARRCVLRLLACWLVGAGLASCTAERFLDDDETLLAAVKVTSAGGGVKAGDYRAYVRQEPNTRWFSVLKVPLGIYCLSGTDSTRRATRFFRKIGEAPVVYDTLLTDYSRRSLTAALQSRGYVDASVDVATERRRRRTRVHYRLKPGGRYYVSEIARRCDSPEMERELASDTAASLLRRGMPLDVAVLNEERSRIIRMLQNRGYYALHKEFVSFRADTLAGEHSVRLTMTVACPAGVDARKAYSPHTLRSVRVYEDVMPGDTADTTRYRGIDFNYRRKLRLYRKVYDSHIALRPGTLYREEDVRHTYAGLNGLSSVNFTNIRFADAGDTAAGASPLLDCEILVQRTKPHTISAELEGTNTSGDLGAAVALTYSNRNIFRGAEMLSLKMRGAYEAITGLEGYNDANYIEFSAEATVRVPSFLFPGVSRSGLRRLSATTDLSLLYNSQNRPEFHRRVLTAAWTYTWQQRQRLYMRHRWDLVSLNYVFMPWISDTFRKNYLEGDDPRYSVLRSSYENLFIVKTGYSLVLRPKGMGSGEVAQHADGYQLRLGAELAGNVLYGLSRLFAPRPSDGQYTLFNIAYSQYAKFDFDYSRRVLLNERNSLAFHCAFGLALPYGNSSIVPYEKRYFSGGANSVRGWSVRELGPGSYRGEDGKIDFINQTGNVKLDLSVEYRTHLLWKFHGAAFIDAGNVWNTRDYLDQPGACFRLNSFYRQIAVAYGLGLRLDFGYFILRLDGGMKAIDPKVPHGKMHYPLFRPDFHRDFTLHFAVGLPF